MNPSPEQGRRRSRKEADGWADVATQFFSLADSCCTIRPKEEAGAQQTRVLHRRGPSAAPRDPRDPFPGSPASEVGRYDAWQRAPGVTPSPVKSPNARVLSHTPQNGQHRAAPPDQPSPMPNTSSGFGASPARAKVPISSTRPLTRPQAPPITGAGDTGIALQRLVKDNGSHAYFIAALRAGSPAALSEPRIYVGDLLVSVGQTEVGALAPEAASNLLKGEQGTVVKLVLCGEESVKNVVLVRGAVPPGGDVQWLYPVPAREQVATRATAL